MKAAISLAVLALIQNISAVDLKGMTDEASQVDGPEDVELLQVDTEKHHRRQHRQSLVAKSKRGAPQVNGKIESPYYKETEGGREWFELDDHTERLHGTEAMDDVQPYDPDVVDDPADMKRVGNDHESLHNAKLSPDGYFNGFYHKDYQGNYAQMKSRSHAKKHHKRHHHHSDEEFLQLGYNHEDDTDDIPEGQDPAQFVQKPGGFQQRQADLANQALFYNANVQLGYEHEDDTEDIPEGLDPVALNKRFSNEPPKSIGELVQEKEEIKMEADNQEVT